MNSDLGVCNECDSRAKIQTRSGIPVCGFGCLMKMHADKEGVELWPLVAHVVFRTAMVIIIAVTLLVFLVAF